MKTVLINKDYRCTQDTVLALGFFDGVHIGHKKILSSAVALAHSAGLCSAVFTFSDTDMFKPNIPRIMPESEKFKLFEQMGFDYLFICPFDGIRTMHGADFATEILIDRCSARFAVCGENFRFGNGRAGTPETLEKIIGKGRAVVCPDEKIDGERVSSTRIRALIQNGDVEKAGEMLSRPFSLSGEVLHGKALGRRLDAPTVNQRFSERGVLPRSGVYATRTVINERTYPSVTNAGTRPTVDGHGVNAETHIIGFDGDLYGKSVKVEFLKFLRTERRFSSVDALRAQIQKDIEEAIEYERGLE